MLLSFAMKNSVFAIELVSEKEKPQVDMARYA